jgi:hypothetical protein
VGVSNPARPGPITIPIHNLSNFVCCSIENPSEVFASPQIARLLLYRAVLHGADPAYLSIMGASASLPALGNEYLWKLCILPPALSILYLVGLGIYRLSFSPLAAYPGPRLAALSNWYEFYWDVIQQGQFTFHIQKLHLQYGQPLLSSTCQLDILF